MRALALKYRDLFSQGGPALTNYRILKSDPSQRELEFAMKYHD